MSEEQRHGREILTIPLPCLLSVIRFEVRRGAGDAIQIPLGAPALSVQLPPLLLGELMVWDEIFNRNRISQHRAQALCAGRAGGAATAFNRGAAFFVGS